VLSGQFEIIRVREYDEHQDFPGDYVASREFRYIPPVVIFNIEMRLQSAEQHDVRALICAKQVEVVGFGRHYPTLTEISTTLGNAIEIKTP